MESNTQGKSQILGFVAVRHHTTFGYFGGYLIVNMFARPLEFHCTLPVQPTRAQQILYGATLDEFICGEQITRCLVQKARLTPDVLFADSEASLSFRHLHSTPIAAIQGNRVQNHSTKVSLPAIRGFRDQFIESQAFGHSLTFLRDYQTDLDAFKSLFEALNSPIDILEPFIRIEEALMEAHPSTKAA